jgi:hypothetical protein
MSAALRISTPLSTTVKTTRASALVDVVRGMSDEQITDELRARREASPEQRIQRETAARRARAQKAAARLRAL